MIIKYNKISFFLCTFGIASEDDSKLCWSWFYCIFFLFVMGLNWLIGFLYIFFWQFVIMFKYIFWWNWLSRPYGNIFKRNYFYFLKGGSSLVEVFCFKIIGFRNKLKPERLHHIKNHKPSSLNSSTKKKMYKLNPFNPHNSKLLLFLRNSMPLFTPDITEFQPVAVYSLNITLSNFFFLFIAFISADFVSFFFYNLFFLRTKIKIKSLGAIWL